MYGTPEVCALRNDETGQELTFTDADHRARFLERVAAEPQDWREADQVGDGAHPFTGEC